jgi:phytoene desaturase
MMLQYSKKDAIGGRARQLKKKMGLPLIWDQVGTGCQTFWAFLCWFWKKTTDYYELIKLSPAYRVYYGIDDFITIADNLTEIIAALKLL